MDPAPPRSRPASVAGARELGLVADVTVPSW
jgi:hypothetical protein